MGNRAFDDFLAYIKDEISNLNYIITVLEKRTVSYKRKADAGNAQAATDLATTEVDMKNKKKAIKALKAFFMKKDWSEVVVWAPPITGLNAPPGPLMATPRMFVSSSLTRRKFG
jgi:hypothetical protein